jgi:hypothetical protein
MNREAARQELVAAQGAPGPGDLALEHQARLCCTTRPVSAQQRGECRLTR